MMHWPRLSIAARHAASVVPSLGIPRDPADPIDLRKFERFTPAEVSALPKRLRLAVQADRKVLKTAELMRDLAIR